MSDELIEVTQADRDAAAPFAADPDPQVYGSQVQKIREGRCDDNLLVQAFARHRTRATLPSDVEADA